MIWNRLVFGSHNRKSSGLYIEFVFGLFMVCLEQVCFGRHNRKSSGLLWNSLSDEIKTAKSLAIFK